eukprot:7492093-Pyramimonas_sp.AAC.1
MSCWLLYDSEGLRHTPRPHESGDGRYSILGHPLVSLRGVSTRLTGSVAGDFQSSTSDNLKSLGCLGRSVVFLGCLE